MVKPEKLLRRIRGKSDRIAVGLSHTVYWEMTAGHTAISRTETTSYIS